MSENESSTSVTGSGCLKWFLVILGFLTFPFGVFFWIIAAIMWVKK